MANTVFQLRRNAVSGTRPTTLTVSPGELAINTTDGILFSANATSIFEIGGNLTSIAVGNTTTRQTANSTGLYVNGTITTSNASVTGNLVIGASGDLVLTSGAGIYANGGQGNTGQVLTSNGSSAYWAAANAGISTIVSEQFTANGTANSFTITGGYIPSAIEVYLSGVKQVPGSDVTVTSGNTVNFVSTPLNGQVVDVFGYVSSGNIGDYLKLTGGTLTGNVTFDDRVGIGNTAPNAKLQVTGTANVSGNVVIGGALTSANLTTTTNTTTIGTAAYFVSSGNVGIGTSSPQAKLVASNAGAAGLEFFVNYPGGGVGTYIQSYSRSGAAYVSTAYDAADHAFRTSGTERARIDSGGNFMVGATSPILGVGNTSTGFGIEKSTDGTSLFISRASNIPMYVGRNSDGSLVSFHESGTAEGSISVSGTTVSFNGGHLARWSQLLNNARDPVLLKGTVLSNLDEMCEWLDAEGNPLPNEQLNKMKVSDVEADPNVAGVFVNWDNDDAANSYDMNIAMTGDMIIRIAQGVVVQRGDLLMSAGNGTAKPQDDDIRRSKTVAKVTSNHVTCTYPDGSYCVPCVLMAC
jgi:filamentous hemagglutinin